MRLRSRSSSNRRVRYNRLMTSAALVALIVGGTTGSANMAIAQTADTLENLVQTDPNAQLLLQADELVYNNDIGTITAIGGVRIDYDGSRLVARQVTYNQNTGRMVAIGSVELLQPDGTVVTGDEVDITDNFSDGFINALRVVTPENARFAAESGERRDGNVTIFNNGFYTACEPCEENPEKPPIWQVKAQKIIWNGEEKTVRFEGASFEFFGIPIARLPVFTTADPTVKRKTGFLAPTFSYSSELGFGVGIPYFIVLAPNMDVTLKGTGYTEQGFLGEAEFRHRLRNGTYTLKIAGIDQREPGNFDLGSVDNMEFERGMIGTKGDFTINPRWSFGWDLMIQSDDNFANTYSISGFDQSTRRENIYLTGLGTRSYFDAELLRFDRQEGFVTQTTDERAPWVLPTIDYNYVVDQDVAGGELSFDVNVRGISREMMDVNNQQFLATRGLEGENARATVQTEWRRRTVMPGGLLLTPSLHAQGDVNWLDVANQAQYSATGAQVTADDTEFRGMVTAGLEGRWPILFTAPGSSHVIEPIAQLFVRPDEPNRGMLPNEDAQSFVFDASTLFERDKFSGFDRIEGGTRANLGIRYTGTFDNGFGINGVFGQSYHLAGTNSFASPDLVNAGASSGLETDTSDFVASLGVTHESGLSAVAGGRFDQDTFDLQRADLDFSYKDELVSLSVGYANIQAQPNYGFTNDREEVSGAASLQFHEYWTAFGDVTYDLEADRVTRNSIGMAYDDECFIFKVSYEQDRRQLDTIEESIKFQLTFKTIGDLGVGSDQGATFN